MSSKYNQKFRIPGIGQISNNNGFILLERCSDGIHRINKDGVDAIFATGDHKIEFICYDDHSIAYVKSTMGYPAYYPVHEVNLQKPIKAVLMDLDGTTVRSEKFWIWIIEQTTASLLGNSKFASKKVTFHLFQGIACPNI